MSDVNSSLPVRTQAAGDVIVKVGDGTTPSQQLAVDSSGRIIAKIEATNGDALTDTGGSLNVNVTNAIATGVTDSAAFVYAAGTETTIGGVFQDTTPTITAGKTGAVRITALRGMHSNLRDSSGNELLGSKVSAASVPVVIASDQGAVPVSQSGTWTVQPGNTQNTTAWLTQDASAGSVTAGSVATKSSLAGGQFNTVLPTLTNTQQAAMQVDASGRLIIRPLTATDVVTSNQGTAAVVGNAWPTYPVVAGAAVSTSNALPVSIQNGTAINNYDTVSAVAAAATSNHDYTTGAAFKLWQVSASASGKLKIEVRIETGAATGVFNTVWVGFNSTSNPNISWCASATPAVVSGAKVRVIRTNLDVAAMDVYSTVSGF